MTTYTVESVNGKTCRHLGVTPYQAARAHVQRHIRTGALTLSLDDRGAFFQAVENGTEPRRIRQPFRVCGS